MVSDWQSPARTLKSLENRLAQVEEPVLALFELQRFRDSRCGAKTRAGRPCRRKGLKNGRCANHGGCSTGPRTREGKARALCNLRQFGAGPGRPSTPVAVLRLSPFD